MGKLSVIIVNYNVKHFLEQCLFAVQKALTVPGISGEIIVIDNKSTDNSITYLQPAFPDLRFIVNDTNSGFGKACNQGLREATGDTILFLNPDTIVAEDSLAACLRFFETHPDAGALGVKMLDGGGHFLKESKRAFPSLRTSLFKLSGLARLFPRSKLFARYHLGHLNENETHEVDVLAGAFMMIRKEVLDKTGSFDEDFFMYGEDVDLSYRIQQAGYKNYYFAGTSIVHFKGESTRRGSLNYVRMFYQAMSIFVNKHYKGTAAGIFNFFIHGAIWIRAFLSAAAGFIRRIGLPLIDAVLILFSFWGMKMVWTTYIRPSVHFPNTLLQVAFPVFTVVYLVVAYYAGLYDRWYKRSELMRSTVIATLSLLAGYALLPEEYRFSRGVLLFGAIGAFLLLSLLRWVLIRAGVLQRTGNRAGHAHTLVVASPGEYDEVRQIISEAGLKKMVLGRVAVQDPDPGSVGYYRQLAQLAHTLPYREIIFCEGVLSFKEIIAVLPSLPAGTRIKFRAAGSRSIVSSESGEAAGEALSGDSAWKIADPYNQRLKRLIDMSCALLFLLSFPLHFFFVKKPLAFLGNCLLVLTGQRTWIGYASTPGYLPGLRKPVMTNNGLPASQPQQFPAENLRMVDEWYARDYEPGQDLKRIFLLYRRLGG